MNAEDGVRQRAEAISADPVARALELIDREKYHAAHVVLAAEFPRNPRLGEIANLIEPCGMIAEARAALRVVAARLQVQEQEYAGAAIQDEEIGRAVTA